MWVVVTEMKVQSGRDHVRHGELPIKGVDSVEERRDFYMERRALLRERLNELPIHFFV